MITGKLVTLTLVREKHLDELYELTTALDNRGPFVPLTLAAEPRFRAQFKETGFWTDEFGRMLIMHAGQMVGSIWYHRTAPYSDTLELGFAIFREADRGKGFMTEAVRLFTDYLFATRKVHRIEMRVLEANLGSVHVAKKVGFSKEGCLRGAFFQSGEHKDLHLYSLLRTDLCKEQG